MRARKHGGEANLVYRMIQEKGGNKNQYIKTVTWASKQVYSPKQYYDNINTRC